MNAQGRFNLALDERCLLQGCSRLLLAVSGGPDSMFLLHSFSRLPSSKRPELFIAHFNHQLRGEASQRDAEFVCDQASRFCLPCHIGEPSRVWDASQGLCLEEWARDARYQWLVEIALKEKCEAVATGHHADDQAETVLMRIARGSGLRGLAGIPWSRVLSAAHPSVRLIRPLLDFRRKEILSFIESEGIPFRVDETNTDLDKTRNRVRREILPLLEEALNPSIVDALCELAARCRTDELYLDEHTQRVWDLAVDESTEGSLRMLIPVLKALPEAVRHRLWMTAFERMSIPGGQSIGRILCSLDELIYSDTSQADLHLPDGWRVSKRYAKIDLKRESKDSDFFYRPLTLGVSLPLPNGGKFSVSIISRDRVAWFPRNQDLEDHRAGSLSSWVRGTQATLLQEAFAVEKIRLPLCVRNRREGDRIFLKSVGHKKVKDILIDMKVPREERDRVPLLVDAEGNVLWIIGYRISDHARVDDETQEVVLAEIEP